MIALIELKRNWKQYKKEGFSQVDRVKLLIHDAKTHYLLAGYAQMSVQQWIVLEAVGFHYKEESEEKFQVFADIIELLAYPQAFFKKVLDNSEEEMTQRTDNINKWNPESDRLLPSKEWNNLWLEDFDRPKLER